MGQRIGTPLGLIQVSEAIAMRCGGRIDVRRYRSLRDCTGETAAVFARAASFCLVRGSRLERK